jgi:AraC-like DNA-binding protein
MFERDDNDRPAAAAPAHPVQPAGARVPWRTPRAAPGAPGRTAVYAEPSAAAARPLAVTLLAPEERPRFDAVAGTLCAARHGAAPADLVRELRAAPTARALVVSTAALLPLGASGAARVGALARAFPVVDATVLVSDARGAPELLLVLGRYGIGRVVDVRVPTGWRRVHELLDRPRADDMGVLLGEWLDAADMPAAVCAFLTTLLSLPPAVATVRAFAQGLGVPPTTLTSRFLRAGLPSPKRYLAFARLVRAARLLEAPGRSLAATALALDYSSAQSFNRHVQGLLGMPACQFRRRYDGRAMLARLCTDLVLPHVTALEALDGGRLPRSAAP